MVARTRNVLSSKGGGLPPFLLVLLLGSLLCARLLPVSAQDGDDAAGSIYRRPLGQDPETLDPARISDTYGRTVSQQIFDGLVQFDQTLAVKPALAEFWRASRDGLTWTFDLRKGVKFHHGREVTADDVVYSFTRILDPMTHLGANAAYFHGAPQLSRLAFRVCPGDQRDTMHDEFLKRNLEDAPVPPRADRRALATGGRHVYVNRPMISLRFCGFNTRTRPLDDRRVRRAIVHAIDREAIVQDVFFGQYTFARGILPPGMVGFNPTLAGYPYDRQKARELLAEAGYPGGRGLPAVAIGPG